MEHPMGLWSRDRFTPDSLDPQRKYSVYFISVTDVCDQLQLQDLVTRVTTHIALQVFCLAKKTNLILINKAFIL